MNRSSADGVRAEVRWEKEPGYYLWEITPRGTQTHLKVFDGRAPDASASLILEHVGPTRVVQRAVVDACTELLVETGEIRYFQEWGSPFPLDELRSLQQEAGLTPIPERTAETTAGLIYPLRRQLATRWQDALNGNISRREAAAWAKEQMRDASHDEAITRGLQALANLDTSVISTEAPRLTNEGSRDASASPDGSTDN